jgi:energy-coupling factor transporter ATP-binding protein EcfA2
MQAGLALARVLMREPQILLLDEPARSLDAASAAAFIRLLRMGLEGRSALWVSHSIGELERGAGRVLHLLDGEIIAPPRPGGFLVLAANGETHGGIGGLVWDDDLGGLRLGAGGDLPAALAALRERGVDILGVERLAAEERTGARA